MQRSSSAAVFAALLFALASGASAYEVRDGGIIVQDPWTNATLRANVGNAVYLIVRNAGTTTLKLTGARSPAAAAATLHESIAGADGVVRMLRVLSAEIPPGDAIALAPEGMHIMLTGLTAPLRENQTVPLTLMFEGAGPVTVDAIVEPVRATGPRARPNPN